MSILKKPASAGGMRLAGIATILALTFTAGPAFADKSDSEAAITRAATKVEMVTRQAGQAGDKGDQSFNMARERLEAARDALKADKYDTAEMLAAESALLADLTSERAALAALMVSRDNLMRASSGAAPAL